jgi:hypothetical protein
VSNFIQATKPISAECYKHSKAVTPTLPSKLWMDLLNFYAGEIEHVQVLEFFPGRFFPNYILIVLAHPTLLLASLRLRCVYRCVGESFAGTC